jgi:hypothetical protein
MEEDWEDNTVTASVIRNDSTNDIPHSFVQGVPAKDAILIAAGRAPMTKKTQRGNVSFWIFGSPFLGITSNWVTVWPIFLTITFANLSSITFPIIASFFSFTSILITSDLALTANRQAFLGSILRQSMAKRTDNTVERAFARQRIGELER